MRRIGNTAFSARRPLIANYWKPIQPDLEGETDTKFVERLGSLLADRIVPEVYRLTPASPYHSAASTAFR
ncbi:AAA family ATPase [Bradyrhizobium sp. RDT10]